MVDLLGRWHENKHEKCGMEKSATHCSLFAPTLYFYSLETELVAFLCTEYKQHGYLTLT